MFKRIFTVILVVIVCSFTSLARQPEKGYRGFVDWDNMLSISFAFISGDGGESRVITGFTTSHGYQFNNWLYVGGGAGFVYNLNWKKGMVNYGDPHMVIPIFAEGRLDAKWGKFTPFLSVQLGANIAKHGGVYFSPMLGYRFNWGRKTAINLGIGATLVGHDNYEWPSTKFTARLGFEF